MHRCTFGCDQGAYVRLCAMRAARGMDAPRVTLTHSEVIAELDAMEAQAPSRCVQRSQEGATGVDLSRARTGATDAPEAILCAAGWTVAPRKVAKGADPWWRCPVSGDDYPQWRAVQVVRGDQ